MTRVFNDPARFKDDMVDGFVSAYDRYVERVPQASGVMLRGGPRAGKVSVIIGGGSGHYPAFCGVVGRGLASGAVIGDIFTSPSTEQAYLVGRALDGGAGVLFSYGNYAGDVMNFGLAEERLRSDGIDARTVLVTDDVASAPMHEAERRRGIAGDFCVFKVAGAAAERGDSMDDVERIARKANDATKSFGVAFAGCRFPGADQPLFTVESGQMEIGLGIHGEPGVRTVDQVSANELAKILVERLLEERPPDATRAAVILNGLGATKYEELFVTWAEVSSLLAGADVEVVLPEVGELVTSLDMAGCSLTLFWLDEELDELWAAPADTPAFRRGALPPDTSSAAAVVQQQAVTPVAVTATDESKRAAVKVRACVRAMRDQVIENEQYLGDLDSAAGDGDHGRGMVRGLTAAYAAVDDEALGAGGVLRAAGMAWADAGGGASGVLWGALLEALGREVGDEARPSADRVAQAVGAAATAVGRLGKANVGDKCMLDALVPFADTLRARVDAGAGLGDAWLAAVGAAESGAEATKDLAPKVGRARPLADRSIGRPDPGATSLALCVGAVGEVLHGRDV